MGGMDKPLTETADGPDPDSPMGKLAAHMREMQEAKQVADDAPAVEGINPVTGEPVKHVRVRMSAADTRRIMAASPEVRQAMAETILAERARYKAKKRAEDAKTKKVRIDRKRRKQLRRKHR